MDLVLVRHAEPMRIIAAEGPADPPLTEKGRKQAEAVADFLGVESFDVIYASPMQRAQETARAIASVTGLDVVDEDGIAEYDRKSEFYIPVEELKTTTDPDLQAHWRALAENRLEDVVEDAHTFAPRVVESMQRIIADHAGQRVIAVCHGGVINVALADILGLDRSLFFLPEYASVHRIAASRKGIKTVVSMNETAHLRGLL